MKQCIACKQKTKKLIDVDFKSYCSRCFNERFILTESKIIK